jgi:hypothetical protein
MTERDKKSGSDSERQDPVPNDESIVPGRHGKHGGSLESEGEPQEPSPESKPPSPGNGADTYRH